MVDHLTQPLYVCIGNSWISYRNTEYFICYKFHLLICIFTDGNLKKNLPLEMIVIKSYSVTDYQGTKSSQSYMT